MDGPPEVQRGASPSASTCRAAAAREENFKLMGQVGEGTYGEVHKAQDKETGEIVALKRVRMEKEKEGVPITAIREIKILKALSHDNIVKLKEIVVSAPSEINDNKGSIYMVMEYLDHDLTGLSDNPGIKFSESQIKLYMKQLLKGIHHCHANNILHRDIKGSNLLIGRDHTLKIADFGLARPYKETKQLTNKVITLWYRPPELLLGSEEYGPGVDMWSVGCIFAELLMGKPILPGQNERDQLKKIYELCGTPTEATWPGVTALTNYDVMRFEQTHKNRIVEVFSRDKKFSHKALDLVEKLLEMDPKRRISAINALDHDYFWDEAVPVAKKEDLPIYEQSSHEYETKKRRKEAKERSRAVGRGADAAKRYRAGGGAAVAPPQPAVAAAAAGGHPAAAAAAGSYAPAAAVAPGRYHPGYAPQPAAAAAGNYAGHASRYAPTQGAPPSAGAPPYGGGPPGYPPAGGPPPGQRGPPPGGAPPYGGGPYGGPPRQQPPGGYPPPGGGGYPPRR